MIEKPFDELDSVRFVYMKMGMEDSHAGLKRENNLSADRIIHMSLELFLVD